MESTTRLQKISNNKFQTNGIRFFPRRTFAISEKKHLNTYFEKNGCLTPIPGNHTGLLPNADPSSDIRLYEQNIPNSYYREFGDLKYAGTGEEEGVIVRLRGLDLGSFTFDIEEISGDDTITASSTFADIPVTSATIATIVIGSMQNTGILQLDIEGDGIIDFSISPLQETNPVVSLGVFESVVKTLGLDKSVTQSIIAKINAVQQSIKKGNIQSTQGQLTALVNYINAQTGKKINMTIAKKLLEIIKHIQVGVVK
ncbi:MAG: hypothetical protein M0P76_05405 [Candidatus Pacebacteria bacterium]|jgi:hypothetical protein|nr:hypothetical protein [Candidatus Paceibacterota bacterium]